MKKRIIAAVSALIMLLSLLSVAAVADDTVGKLDLANISKVTAGSTFKLTMTLINVSDEIYEDGIISVSFDLDYDHTLIETSDKTIGGKGFADWEISSNVSDSSCTFMICDVEGKAPIKKNGDLVITLDFTVGADVAGEDVIITVKNVELTTDSYDTYESSGDVIDFIVVKKSTVSTIVDGIKFAVDTDSETASVTSVENKSEVVIPSAIDYNGTTLKVVEIESGAFADASSLKTVYIPCTVTSVSSSAFNGDDITIKGCRDSAAFDFAMNEGYNWETDTSRYEEKVTKEPTCTEKGTSQLVCPDCGAKTGEAKELPLVDHKYGDWTITKEATETEEGSRERVCSVCGNKDTEVIPKTNCEHEETKDVITKEATCTETGSKNIVCASCGKVLEENVEIPKADHTFGEWEVIKEATIKEKGTRERTCSVCGLKETEEIPVLACKHENTVNGHRDPTCTKDGYDSTTCKDCGKLISYTPITATHKEGPTETKDPTCTTDGYIIQKCTACGEELRNEVLPATGHEFGEWQVLVPPTTLSEGTNVRTCEKCGTTEVQVIDKLEPEDNSEPESVPSLEESEPDVSSSIGASDVSDNPSSGGSNKTIFIIIGAIVLLLTVGYIVIMAINKKKSY